MMFVAAQTEMSNTSKWENRTYGVNKARNKKFYKIKNDARILDLMHYFGRSWRPWFDESMYTGYNSRGVIYKTKGIINVKSNRSRQTLNESRT